MRRLSQGKKRKRKRNGHWSNLRDRERGKEKRGKKEEKKEHTQRGKRLLLTGAQFQSRCERETGAVAVATTTAQL